MQSRSEGSDREDSSLDSVKVPAPAGFSCAALLYLLVVSCYHPHTALHPSPYLWHNAIKFTVSHWIKCHKIQILNWTKCNELHWRRTARSRKLQSSVVLCLADKLCLEPRQVGTKLQAMTTFSIFNHHHMSYRYHHIWTFAWWTTSDLWLSSWLITSNDKFVLKFKNDVVLKLGL